MQRETMRVLVADDDREDTWIVSHALLYNGYEVDTAADGEEAIAKVRKTEPDLVVFDVMMPLKTGIEAANVLRGDRKFQELPFIFLTGLKNDHGTSWSGRNVVLAKPLRVTQLVDAVARLLAPK